MTPNSDCNSISSTRNPAIPLQLQIVKCQSVATLARLAPMWQQPGTLLFCSCHGIAGLLVDELQI